MEPEKLRGLVASGQVAIPSNIHHKSLSPEGIGTGLRTKINVNLGISGDAKNYDIEFEKFERRSNLGRKPLWIYRTMAKQTGFVQN